MRKLARRIIYILKKSHCEVLGMDLMNFEEKLLRDLVHLSRLENFLLAPKNGNCETAAVKERV